jgi:hypothetical protein
MPQKLPLLAMVLPVHTKPDEKKKYVSFGNGPRHSIKTVNHAIITWYGFVANMCYLGRHNLVIQLAHSSSFLLNHHSQNLACHNLCTIKQPSVNYQSLLGLGLNF